MTPLTTPLEDKAREVLAKLTKARVEMILALPADGSWGAVPSRSVAKRAWRGMIPGIIDHKHCPTDRNEWALTSFGQNLRATAIEALKDTQ